MLTPSEIETLKTLTADSRFWAEWSTRAVVAGLILELLVEFLYTTDKRWSEIVLSVAAGAIIAIGVYGELHFGDIGARANIGLQRDSDARVAQANERAANAEKDAANARLETAKIEKEFAPRRLAPDQLARIASAVKPFAGEHINIDTYRDVEPWFIADRIHIALTGMQGFDGAGWVGNVIAVTELNRAVSGILIEVTPKADSRAHDAADRLASALRAEQLVVVGPTPIWPALRIEGFGIVDNDASIHLTVGVNLPTIDLGAPNLGGP